MCCQNIAPWLGKVPYFDKKHPFLKEGTMPF
jgi:hypothetical protein